MRADMYEVLIERPRGGAGWGRGWPRFDWRQAADYAARENAAQRREHLGLAAAAGTAVHDADAGAVAAAAMADSAPRLASCAQRDDQVLACAARRWADGGPTKLRMGPRQRSKWLSENLAPLRRFLRRRVGQPWNAVHAEICAHIKLDSAVQKHVLDHLWHYVERNPVFIDNWPHHAEARRWGRINEHGYSPLSDYGRGFYVCPQTGTLQHVRRFPRRVRSDVAVALPPG
ncbi:MAG: hypothetical protein JNJ46_05940 [Myxococcales bacterium]|nr:hypothetical protein [Myxococcales bacterium]